MRKIALLLSICFSQLTFAQIDTLTLSSKISDVTVFFSGAQVTRTGKVELEKGKHILLFDQLPITLNSASVQISGFAHSTILSVKSDMKFYNATQKSEETKTIEKTIEELKVSNKRLTGRYEVLETEQRILIQNSQFSGKDKGVSIDELKAAADYYRLKLTEIRNSLIDIQIEQKQISEDIKNEYGKLNQSIAKKKKAYKQVFVAVELTEKHSEEFDFQYYVPTAGWTPSYDFRVKDTDSPLKIIYNSNVFQSTGEDWNKVNVTLSTNNPSIGGIKPSLKKWTIGRVNSYTNRNYELPNIERYGTGEISGTVSESNLEPIPFANITLLGNGSPILSATSDFDGRYTLKPVPPGVYSLKISYVGFKDETQDFIQVDNSSILQRDFILESQMERKEIQKMAVRSVADITKTAGNGITSSSNEYNHTNNVRGQRNGSSVTFVDGVKIIGSTNLPKSAVEEVSVNISDPYKYVPPYPDYRNRRFEQDQNLTFENRSVNDEEMNAQYGDIQEISSRTNVSNSNLSLEYNIQIPYSIPSDGKEYNLKIKETDIVAEYEYHIIPKIDKDAFLIANIINWEKLNLLTGKSNLYYKGTFIGVSFVNAEQTEDTMSISLGREKSIFISRTLSKEVEERQLYSNSIKEFIGWDLVVRNTKKTSVSIKIEDQYPTSERKAIEVDLTSYDGAVVDEKLGQLTWNFTLKPDEKKEFGFKYNIKYPKYSNFEIR